jgi:hypothetical protein
VIVDDLNFIWSRSGPPETDAILVIDPDAVLPSSIASELLKPIARRYRQVVQLRCRIQLINLSIRNISQ